MNTIIYDNDILNDEKFIKFDNILSIHLFVEYVLMNMYYITTMTSILKNNTSNIFTITILSLNLFLCVLFIIRHFVVLLISFLKFNKCQIGLYLYMIIYNFIGCMNSLFIYNVSNINNPHYISYINSTMIVMLLGMLISLCIGKFIIIYYDIEKSKYCYSYIYCIYIQNIIEYFRRNKKNDVFENIYIIEES